VKSLTIHIRETCQRIYTPETHLCIDKIILAYPIRRQQMQGSRLGRPPPQNFKGAPQHHNLHSTYNYYATCSNTFPPCRGLPRMPRMRNLFAYLQYLTVRGYRGMLCEDACGNLENLVRIIRNFRTNPQKYGDIRFNKIGNPRKNPRSIPQYFIIFENLLIYIKKEDSFNEDHFSIDIIR
jgi:hypothetical protein